MAAVAWVLLSPALALAVEGVVGNATAEQARIYTTREERRDAGLEHKITETLTLNALGELEYRDERFGLFDTGSRSGTHDFSRTLQLGLELRPWPWGKADFIFEYHSDSVSEQRTVDEAIVTFEPGNLEVEVGRLNLPFGAFISHFVSGPLLEFGETRGDAVVMSYKAHDRLDLAVFSYQGRAESLGAGGRNLDYGFALESSGFSTFKLGMSYLSDLADSQERLLRDGNDRYQTRVDAMSAYAIGSFDRFEVSAEFLGALDSFKELDPDRDRPRSWNLELAYFPVHTIEGSLRFEGSSELEGAPRRQIGLALAWRVARKASLTVEYLRGWFKRGFAQESSERDVDRIDTIGTQFSMAF